MRGTCGGRAVRGDVRWRILELGVSDLVGAGDWTSIGGNWVAGTETAPGREIAVRSAIGPRSKKRGTTNRQLNHHPLRPPPCCSLSDPISFNETRPTPSHRPPSHAFTPVVPACIIVSTLLPATRPGLPSGRTDTRPAAQNGCGGDYTFLTEPSSRARPFFYRCCSKRKKVYRFCERIGM